MTLRLASCSARVGGTMVEASLLGGEGDGELANCGDGNFLFRNFLVLSLLRKEVSWETRRSRRANYDNLGC